MLIALNTLDAHPLNANVMPQAMLAKLISHIRECSLYPPLIVRPMPNDRYQILDGHHRAIALRRLNRTHAECQVWQVDDQRAVMLLLTLNRLHGEDDPHARGELLALLAAQRDEEELHRLMPDDAHRIERLIALARDEPMPVMPSDEGDHAPPPPCALTFFLDRPLHDLAIHRLESIHADRNIALVRALGLSDRAANNGDHS